MKFSRWQAIVKRLGSFDVATMFGMLMNVTNLLGFTLVFGVVHGLISNYSLFEQKADHFHSPSGVFYQRYWHARFGPAKNGHFGQWHPKNELGVSGVAFLMISGESVDDNPMTGAWLEYAKRFAEMGVEVVCFELEHRYYGSRPKTPGYELLSSDQALEDIRYFVTKMSSNVEYFSFKWVVFGGSYAGSLAAWARQMYPRIIHAAVSSSSPVEAKADLSGYLDLVKQSLMTVTDEPDCAALVAKLAKQQTSLVSDVESLVQYGFQENACKLASCMAKTGDYASCHEQWYQFVLDSAADSASRLLDFQQYSFVKKGFHGTAWQYQMCTEFGWFATSGSPSSFFGSLYPLSSFVRYLCQNDTATLQRGIAHVNAVHNGTSFSTERVLFVHGQLDPWKSAGMTSSRPRTPLHVVEGGSHCLDMHTVDSVLLYYRNPDLAKEVESTHELTMKYLTEWLKE